MFCSSAGAERTSLFSSQVPLVFPIIDELVLAISDNCWLLLEEELSLAAFSQLIAAGSSPSAH